LHFLEKIGGNAIIIGHIGGTGCSHDFGERLRGLIERYQHVVRFSLYGHAHSSKFWTRRSYNTNKNIGASFISGSVTTFKDVNPGFVVMEMDEEYMVPVDYKIYWTNITDANIGPKKDLEWKVLVDYKKDYKVPDLSPDSMYNLALRFKEDEDLAIDYLWN